MTINYQNVLPDPNNTIGSAGQNSGTAGPGYAGVQLISTSPIMKSRTNSGRMVARAVASHKWEVGISYNPMTRLQFEPVYNFLINRRGGMKPFFVSLPQYRRAQDGTFADYAEASTGANIKAIASVTSGSTSMTIDGLSSSSGSPSPGDLFTVTDANDSNHTKTYRVTQVETNATYDSTQPTTAQRIIHFVPGLAKAVANNSTIIFHNPLIRVTVASGVQEYSLGTNGLYSFSLKLEEAQP
jgi:hypothetical protein|tara:strand:- start:4645 stop:5367 length:723 start_codon:yes stop_codon:yes gene_type:complete